MVILGRKMACFRHPTPRGEVRLAGLCGVLQLLVVLLAGGVGPARASYLQEVPLELRPPGGQTGLHFGFSLAHYTNQSQRWLLVGAPRSNASKPEVEHSGGLYKCQLSKSDAYHECDVVNVDLTNDGAYPLWAKSNNTDQGLGFTLASDGTAIVVCAPQWFAARSKFNEWNYLPAGMCFAAKSPAYKFKAFSPPFHEQTVLSMTYLTTGSCQFGMSVAYVKGQDTFAFGGPGCWTWRGDTWEVGLGSESDVKLDSSRFLGKLQQDGIDSTRVWEAYGRYVGYSVASLNFGGRNAIVSSIPRIAEDSDEVNFVPTILILTQHPSDASTLVVNYRISPSKVTQSEIRFAFFGYSLATLDLNGDGLEDLVVGAPFYNDSLLHYDPGAVFIYMQTTSGPAFEMKEENDAPQRVGSKSFSRFGSCLAAIGDVDGDGYEDLAVGAPFMAVESQGGAGTGAVYIYMGSEKGLEKEARQIIKAAANQFGFGSSIAQQLPSIEGEGYDVAVGAYDSDAVLVFKSKEVVSVTWNLTFSEPIDLTSGSCLCLGIASLCPCVDLNFCLMYHKKIVKNGNAELGFSIVFTTMNDELYFANGKTEVQKTFEVQEGSDYCDTLKVVAKSGIEEIKSFSIAGDVSLDEEATNVVIDRHSILRKSEQLNIVIRCNATDISGCQSDITLQYIILDNYELMTSKSMKIHFKVKNQGETAYESKLNIQSSDVFIISRVENNNITCENNINEEIQCKLGRLYNNSEVSFNLSLAPAGDFLSSLDTHAAVFNLIAQVKTLSAISHPNTAIQRIEAPIIVEGSLQLIKQAPQPSIVYFNSSSYYKSPQDAKSEEELGPEIKHEYSILNANKFSIYAAELLIHWPLTIDGQHFLYLLEKVSLSGMSHSCQYPDGVVDPFQLTADTHTQGGQSYKVEASALQLGIGDKSPEYTSIRCRLGEILGNNGQVTVSLRSRLVLRTLVELEVGTGVENASSFVDLQITKMPLNYTLPKPSRSSISTTISYQRESPDAKVPVWLYVVSVLAGLLLLAGIVIVLWKCGFFNRQRAKMPDNADENQERHPTKEEEDESDELQTPTSPMLKETESAAEDFEFHRG